MSGFQITITDAGRAALINAQNTGTVAFVLSEIGVSAQAIADDLASLTALPNERKRLATMAGDVVADDTLHVTIRDESADAYALRSFGLYASTGVLFAVYSQSDPILEKSAAAMLLLAVDARLVALGTANVEFGPAGFTLPPASETIAGVVEIATDAEVDAGQDPWRVITARTLKRALGALSNFAPKDHKHDAADVETGTFHANRIPELPMSRIGGLIATLADKASALHSHTMSQVSGLIAALEGKEPLLGFKPVQQGTGVGQHSNTVKIGWDGAKLKATVDSTDQGAFAFLNQNVNFADVRASRGGTGILYLNNVAPGQSGERFLYNSGEAYFLPSQPLYVDNGLVWTSRHFAAADLVKTSTTGLGKTGAGAFITFGSPQSYGVLPTGFTAMVPPGQPGMPNSGYSYFSKIARRDAADGYAALVVTHTASAGDKPEAWFGGSHSANEWPSWAKVWTDQNFNPADRAPALHSHDWAQLTGKPHLATTDGTGVSFGSWNFGVAVRVNGSDWRYLPNDARVEDIINWRAANNAETLAGALTHKFVSPAALWSFARSIGPNGYQQIPGTDLIIQWGVSNGSHPEGAVHAALPVAFGGGCLIACATPRNAGQAYGMDFVMQIVGRYLDRIVFYANRANSSSGNMSGYEWMAVGLARGNPDPAYSTGYPPGGGGGGGGEDPFFRPEV